MRITIPPALSLTALLITAAFPAHAADLHSAAEALGVANIQSLSYSGSGAWFQFGQAPAPTLAWPRFDVSRYSADVDFAASAARVQLTRSQTVDPRRQRPAPVEQRVDQYVRGASAWNLAPAAAGAAAVASAQPAAVAERQAEIWATPQGFLKAALANGASSKPSKGGGATVAFTVDGKYRYVGTINAASQVEQVRTWIDNPVLGDTVVETRYSRYADFGGVQFPGSIVRTQGGHPVLQLNVDAVSVNPALAIAPPADLAPTAAVAVSVNKLAEGVFYLTGGSHHSVAIEQRDHVVVVEAPLNEERALAVIAKVKETIPGKPIRYLVNTHAHFDHSGGLRTYVDEGAIIVTQRQNQAYYKKAWAAPRTLNPDRLAQSGKAARFETFSGKHVLTDGTRRIEIHPLAGNTHNDAFGLVYLPGEKLLIEADAYTPLAANAAPPAAPNPYSVNLYQNIQKLKLEVSQIAPLHGRLVALADLRAAVGQGAATAN